MTQNYFSLFHLPENFSVDLVALDANYRKLQAEVHPDKFVTATPAERLKSMQTATLANEAYQTLKNPTARARYMLESQGFAVLEESNTAMPADFLMLQMEWREAIEDAKFAKDISALDAQLATMQTMAKSLQEKLSASLSNKNTFPEAAQIVRKLSFIDKVSSDVKNIIAQLED
jgi:molecular chaperone HscB